MRDGRLLAGRIDREQWFHPKNGVVAERLVTPPPAQCSILVQTTGSAIQLVPGLPSRQRHQVLCAQTGGLLGSWDISRDEATWAISTSPHWPMSSSPFVLLAADLPSLALESRGNDMKVPWWLIWRRHQRGPLQQPLSPKLSCCRRSA